MIHVAAADLPALRPWFAPERPGPLVWAHAVRTGRGGARVDRWPEPRTVVAAVARNWSLRGEPSHLGGGDAGWLVGFVDAPPRWEPVLHGIDPGVGRRERVIFEQRGDPEVPRRGVRRLAGPDAPALVALDPELRWISDTWGGPDGLARAEVGHGAFADGRLVSVAVPFYAGEHFEDLGVVTEPDHRCQGLSRACAAAVLADVARRGRRPTWTTSPDNSASLAVAARLGFREVRRDLLYAVRTPIPTS